MRVYFPIQILRWQTWCSDVFSPERPSHRGGYTAAACLMRDNQNAAVYTCIKCNKVKFTVECICCDTTQHIKTDITYNIRAKSPEHPVTYLYCACVWGRNWHTESYSRSQSDCILCCCIGSRAMKYVYTSAIFWQFYDWTRINQNKCSQMRIWTRCV